MKRLKIRLLKIRIAISEWRIGRVARRMERMERRLDRLDQRLQKFYDHSGELCIRMLYMTGQAEQLVKDSS